MKWEIQASFFSCCFGIGLKKEDIKLRLGSLLLDLGNGDAVHIGAVRLDGMPDVIARNPRDCRVRNEFTWEVAA